MRGEHRGFEVVTSSVITYALNPKHVFVRHGSDVGILQCIVKAFVTFHQAEGGENFLQLRVFTRKCALF